MRFFIILFYLFIFLLIPLFYAFSGYIKAHGLKYQTTLFPNGMVTGVFGTSANHNDIGFLNLLRLAQHLEQILFPQNVMPGGLLPALFGDSVFQGHNYSTIISRYDPIGTVEQRQFLSRINFRMSGVRQSIEHMYGQLFNLFHLLKTPRQFKLYNNGELAYRTAVVCFLKLFSSNDLSSSSKLRQAIG